MGLFSGRKRLANTLECVTRGDWWVGLIMLTVEIRSDNEEEPETADSTEIEMVDRSGAPAEESAADANSGDDSEHGGETKEEQVDPAAKDDGGDGGHSHGHGHSHSHGHGHSHGHPGGGSGHDCEWNYINIIVAIFCTAIILMLLALLIFYLTITTGPLREYYIAIEDADWSYAPGGNMCGAESDAAYDAFANESSAFRIGSAYRKARYVLYTDETFTTRADVAPEEEHLGILGPLLRASVGETLRIYVRNDASFPFSVNPWGLRIAKASEGAGYEDTSFFFERYDDAIAPLALNQYTCTGFGINARTGCRAFLVHPGQYVMQDWPVTEEAGPQEGDGDSIMWLYTSDVDGQIEPGINAGLVGAIIVDDGTTDTTPDFEFVNVFLSSDENESPYLDINMWDKLVTGSYGEVVSGWVPFGFLDQTEVLRALFARAANPTDSPQVTTLDYTTAASLVASSIATQEAVDVVEGVHIGVQFTDPESNPLDSNSFDPTTFNGRYGDGAAQQVIHALFVQALDELKNDEAFQESNRVQTINGYSFCNQPGLVVDFSDADDSDVTVRWYTSAVGGSDSLHAPVWTGNAAAGANAQVIAGSTSVTDMLLSDIQPGEFYFEDAIMAHASQGARSTYTVSNTAAPTDFFASQSVSATTQDFYLKAVEVEWDYLPDGANSCVGNENDPVPSELSASKFSIGSTYSKWRFLECTDATCATTVTPAEHLGITGPTLNVAAGDLLQVTLFNEVTENITLHASGLMADANAVDTAAAPGASATFTWYVPSSAAAEEEESTSRAWTYHASTAGQVNAGLFGAVIVSNDATTTADEEFALFLGTLDENSSPLATQNAIEQLDDLRNALNVSGSLTESSFEDSVAHIMASNSDFYPSNLVSSVNGLSLCNLALNAAADDAVRLHLLIPPTSSAVESAQVSGHDITTHGHRTQTATIFPASSVSLTTTARAGNWVVSGTNAQAGVSAAFDVTGSISEPSEGTKADRTFFIAADEVEWDYAPHGYDKCHVKSFDDDEDSAKYMRQGQHRIGSQYVKAQYRRYTDNTFSVLQSGTSSRGNSASLHLGILGTIITVEVGDTLEICFKNKLRFPASFVLPGPFQSAAINSTTGEVDTQALDPVAPGEVRIYKWVISEEMGPADSDSNSIIWAYTSPVSDPALGLTPDAMTNAGLIGAVIVVADGEMKGTQTMPKDVEVEFIVLTGTFDENLSPYLRLNAQKYADEAYSINYEDPEFQESNRMRSINGLMYCNGQGWLANMYQKVRFYILGTGSGIHSLNLHSHSLVDRSTNRNGFGASVFAAGAVTADTVVSSPGDWLLESSIASDTLYGAQELFTVHPLVTQFFKQVGADFQQRDSEAPTNHANSVLGES